MNTKQFSRDLLKAELGLKGYGAYHVLVDMLTEQSDSLPLNYKVLQKLTHIPKKLLQQVVENYGLFTIYEDANCFVLSTNEDETVQARSTQTPTEEVQQYIQQPTPEQTEKQKHVSEIRRQASMVRWNRYREQQKEQHEETPQPKPKMVRTDDTQLQLIQQLQQQIQQLTAQIQQLQTQQTQTQATKEQTLFETPPPKPKRFIKPTIEEVETYIKEQTYTMKADEFWDFYESKGWKVGSEPMKDWKAAVRNWNRNRDKYNNNNNIFNNSNNGKNGNTNCTAEVKDYAAGWTTVSVV